MATVPKVQLLRGLKANLPAEALAGVPVVTLDTAELFVGNGIGQPLIKISDIVVASVSTGIDHSKIWIDTAANQVKRWSGSAWIPMDVASFASITGSPTDNAALSALLATYATITYVDEQIAGLGGAVSWQNPVLDIVDTLPALPTVGDRYLLSATAGSHPKEIAEYESTGWEYKAPTIGMVVDVISAVELLYIYNGSAWVAKAFDSITASGGLERTANDVHLSASVAGEGLKLTAGVLEVDVIDCGTF
jgi:hypothetical protein